MKLQNALYILLAGQMATIGLIILLGMGMLIMLRRGRPI